MAPGTVPRRRTPVLEGALLLVFTWWCLTLGLFLYKSYNVSMFGRYSIVWFTFACLNLAGVVAATVMALRSYRRRKPEAPGGLPLLSLAAATWGVSLLTQYPVDRGQIAFLLWGQVLGATRPAGVVLESVALVFVVLALGRLLAGITARGGAGRAAARAGMILVVGLLLAEGGVRAINIWHPRTQEAPTKPSWMWHARYVRNNDLGYRDRDVALRPGPAEYRILLLGDSITFGWGIRDTRDRFGERLETALDGGRGRRRVRVINAAIGGYDSEHELKVARDLVPRLRPNLVLLIYVFNDLEHLAQAPVHPALRPPSVATRFSPHRLLMLNSHFFDQALLLWRAWTWTSPSRGDFYLSAYRDEDLIRRHLDVVERIEAASTAYGATFRIAPFDLFPDERYRERYARFVTALEARALPVWSMQDVFDGHPYRALVVNHRDRHPNELAHRLFASQLTPRVAGIASAAQAGRRTSNQLRTEWR